MDVQVIEAGEELKSLVLNLGMYYIYDFSETLGFRCGEDGLYRTDFWAKYFRDGETEPDRWAFLVRVDGEPAGFALIGPDGTQPGSRYDVAQFFIMRKFRRRGVGQIVAHTLFDRFRGPWEIRILVQNLSAQAFWRTTVDRYTHGQYTELPDPVQCDGWMDIVLTFDNTRP